MIDLKMKNILDCGNIVKKISQLEFPASTAYKLAVIIKALDDKHQEFIAQQNLLFRKYGERDTRGELIIEDGITKIKEEDKPIFTQESYNLLETCVQFDLEPINVNEIGNFKVSPMELLPLLPFLQK